MERREDWEQRLNDYLAGTAARKHTCSALFVADAVKAMTGKDFARGLRGFDSVPEGETQLKDKTGHDSLTAYLEEHLPRTPKAMARRGDVVMIKGGELAIAFGEVALAFGDDIRTGHPDIVRVPREDWRKAWQIG